MGLSLSLSLSLSQLLTLSRLIIRPHILPLSLIHIFFIQFYMADHDMGCKYTGTERHTAKNNKDKNRFTITNRWIRDGFFSISIYVLWHWINCLVPVCSCWMCGAIRIFPSAINDYSLSRVNISSRISFVSLT